MTVWKHVTTDVITGDVLCDDLPLTVSTLHTAIGSIGEGSAELRDYEQYRDYITPRKTIWWALADGIPVWHGIITSIDASSAKSGTVGIQAKGIEYLFEKRRIHEDKLYDDEDPFDIFRSLVTYATGKTNGSIANLIVSTDDYGDSIDRSYLAVDHGVIYELLNNLAETKDFEWQIRPYLVDGILKSGIVFGNPELTTNFVPTFYFPGEIADYSWPINGTSAINSLMMVGDTYEDGTQMTSGPTHGIYQDDIDDGYPLLEDTLSASGKGIINQTTIDANADAAITSRAGSVVSPTMTVSIIGDITPLSYFILGGYCNLVIISPIHPSPDGKTPGLMQNVRMVGFDIAPGSASSTESITITLGELTL